VHRAADALPPGSSIVTSGIAAAQPPSPSLPAAAPLLGQPSGITLANVDDNGALERLDLDTGRMTLTQLTPPAASEPGIQPDFPTNGFPVTPLASGVIFIDNGTAWWTPRRGPSRSLGPVTTVFAQSPVLAWVVAPNLGPPGPPGSYTLSAVNGLDGSIERRVVSFAAPLGAVSSGLVELLPATIDRPDTIDVWDPSSGMHHPIGSATPGTAFNGLISSGGNTIVWRGACSNPSDSSACPAEVTNVVTGATNTYQSWSPRSTSVAPDGDAVAFIPESGDYPGDLHVLDVATGTITHLPDANGFGSIVWGPNGWIFYATDTGLAAWRPGMVNPRFVPGVLMTPSTTGAF
jgi:hypothetical protein